MSRPPISREAFLLLASWFQIEIIVDSQIGKNAYYDHLRKSKRYAPIDEAPEGEAPISVEMDFETKETAYRIHRILHHLQEPYKEVFTLRTFGELSFREISNLFGKSESWAKMTYLRAKKKIQEAMEREDGHV